MGSDTVATRFAASAGDTILVRARMLSHGVVSDWSSEVTVSAPSAPTIPPAPEYTEASYFEVPIDSGGNSAIYLYAKIVSDESGFGYDAVENLTYRMDSRDASDPSAAWVIGDPVFANQTETYQVDSGENITVVIVEQSVPDFGDYEVRLSTTNSAGTSEYTLVSESSDQPSAGDNTGNITL